VIRCARVTLRRLILDDAPAIAAYRSDPDVARYQSWETYPIERAEELCRTQQAIAFGAPGTWAQLAIVRNEDGAVIGDCGVHFLADDPRTIELGITMSTGAQGKGFAREALAGVIEHVGVRMGVNRVRARVDTRNTPALRVFERLGFAPEGPPERAMFKGNWCEEVVLARSGADPES